MPKETFWNSATAVENDGVSEPVLTVTWGEEQTGVYLNGVHFDQSGIDRLATVLRRATGKDRTVTVTLTASTDAYVAGMERAAEATKRFAESTASLATDLKVAGVTDSDLPEAIMTALKVSRSTSDE